MSGKFASILGLEERILLGCARLDLNEQNRAQLDELLQQPVDWEALFQRSLKQSMTPLLYVHLQSESTWWHRVPAAMRAQLEQIYRRNTQRNRLLLGELDQLLTAFNAAEVPVILMKELHLLHTVYHEPGWRPIGDLDLLVPSKDFEHAKALLGDAGYYPQLPVNPFKNKYGFGYHFVNQDKGIWIDLQWNVSQREWAPGGSSVHEFRAPIDDVWKRAVPGRLQESRIWRMAWEDLLFHLCVHLEGHGFNEMIQLCDIAEVIRLYGETINWKSFIDVARASRMQGSVFCSFDFIQQVLGVSLPAEVLAALRPDYLKFELYSACFGALGRLHTFLDEAASDSCVPVRALQQWEETVRQTAARNLQSYAALTTVTQTLANDGLYPVVLMTRGPEQLLPHPKLERVGESEILVMKKNPAEKRPLLADDAGNLSSGAELRRTIPPQWSSALPKSSSRQLLKKIWRAPQREQTRPISIHVVATEETLLVLCRRFVHSPAPWPALCMVAEFLRHAGGGLNWQKFWNLAQQHDAARDAALVLKSVAELTSVEVPAAAFQPVANLQLDGVVELFPLATPHDVSAPQLKQALLKIHRFFLLPTAKDRRDYLINLIKESCIANGLFPKFWQPVIEIGRFCILLLHDKMQRPAFGAALQVYWLETPQVIAAKAASPGSRRRKAAELKTVHPALATP
jgi:hypothetical protein